MLKKENTDVRDHFEHSQQRTAADKQQEREQFHSTNQQLQGQIQDLRGQLINFEKRLSEQNKENIQHLETIDMMNSEN